MTVKPRVLVVAKRSAYESYGQRAALAKRLLAERDPTVARIVPAHEEHVATLAAVRACLAALGARTRFVRASRAGGAWFPDGAYDLVVTVGGDGTLLAASHHVASGTPILGINSAPADSVGFFCAATRSDASDALTLALRGEVRAVTLSRMQVVRNGRKVHNRVLNEALFCHASPAATSRYLLQLEGDDAREGPRQEEQKSSGFWIGPAAGSTAAQRSAGGRILRLSSKQLQLVVREPYTPRGVPLHLARALLSGDERLVVRCKMREARLFLDGDHTMIRCRLGDVLTFARSADPLDVLGLPDRAMRAGFATGPSSR